MTNLERMIMRTGDSDEALLSDCLDSAKAAIMSRRFPYGDWPDELEARYLDLQLRCAIDIYEKQGAEGEIIHEENGVKRHYESPFISEQLLREVVPFAGAVR